MRRRSPLLALLLLGCPSTTEAPPPQCPAEPHATTDSGATPGANEPSAGLIPATPPPPQAARALAKLSADRLRADIDALAGFGTRHTLSSAADGRGIAAARDYIAAQMRAAIVPDRRGGPLSVTLDRHALRPDGRRIDREAELVNVVATLPGTMPQAAHRHIYVMGHYDSRASDVMQPDADAPGANDDGSGTALTIELARVLADQPLDATVVFMTTAGEEQGLLGASAHAAAARAEGRVIAAVLNNDIVGDPTAPDGSRHDRTIRLFSAGVSLQATEDQLAAARSMGALADSRSRQLARHIAAVSTWEQTPVQPVLVLRPDRFLRGGDHLAFDREGYAAVRFTEVAENYERQHQDPRTEGGRTFGDAPDHVDTEYLAEVARVNGAAIVHLANAPAPPQKAAIVATELVVDTTVQWSASTEPEPDLAGYEVVWRPTSAPDWTHQRDVGTQTSVTLPLHKDDWIFGVRAYDRDGYRSPVAACGVVR